MAKIDLNKVPRFSELPIKPDKPKESSWGVFGDDDELGCLNFLTPEGVIDAARLVRKGSVFRLDTKINYANPPLFARSPAKHNIMSFESFGLLGFDDSLDSYNTQEGSQWDGLAHVGSPRYKAFYNGVKSSEIKDGPERAAQHPQMGQQVCRPRRAARRVSLPHLARPHDRSAQVGKVQPRRFERDGRRAGRRAEAGHDSADSHGLDAGVRCRVAGRQGRDGAARRAQGLRHRGQQRDGRMVLGSSASPRSAPIVPPSSRGRGISRMRARCITARYAC